MGVTVHPQEAAGEAKQGEHIVCLVVSNSPVWFPKELGLSARQQSPE